jgi:hypothetical protein
MDVASQATHASDALSQNERETNSLIQTLSGSGVNQSDIQTASLSIDPVYGSDGQSITGYQVDETVAVTLRDLSTAGTVLDAAARSVGDDIRIESMALSISDTSSLMAQARAQAMADAKTKAGQLASGPDFNHTADLVRGGRARGELRRPRAGGVGAAERQRQRGVSAGRLSHRWHGGRRTPRRRRHSPGGRADPSRPGQTVISDSISASAAARSGSAKCLRAGSRRSISRSARAALASMGWSAPVA